MTAMVTATSVLCVYLLEAMLLTSWNWNLTIVSSQLKLKPDYCLQPALNWNWNLPIHIQSARASATSGLRRRRNLRGTGALDWFCTNISTKVAILCTLVRKEDKNFNFFPWGTGIKEWAKRVSQNKLGTKRIGNSFLCQIPQEKTLPIWHLS